MVNNVYPITYGSGYGTGTTVAISPQVTFASIPALGSPSTGSVQLTSSSSPVSGHVVWYDSSQNVQDSGTPLSSLAPLASPGLTGTPTAPTPVSTDNSTKLATTAFVATATSTLAPLASPTFTGTATAPTVNATSGFQLNGASIQASAILNASCIGIDGSAASTVYVLSPGAVGNVVCSVLTAAENPMPYACTAKNLYVNLGTAGSHASSGVTTVYQAGSATSITCTTGTATTCSDTTHTVSFTAGQTWSIRYETGSSANDTIHDVRAAFQCQ